MAISDDWIDGYKSGVNATIEAFHAEEKRKAIKSHVTDSLHYDLPKTIKNAKEYTFGKVKRPRGRPRKSLG